MPINQPQTSIRLTNVSLVKLKKGKKRFEIACYQNKVQDWRSGVEKDLDEVLQIPRVFLNVSKGLVAPNEELEKAFKTTDTDKIILEILNKGEIQLGEKERHQNIENMHREILNIISTKCINPKSKKRYPPSIIDKVLHQINFNVSISKPAKGQALEAIKILVEKQIIPIARAKMKVKLQWANREYKRNLDKVKPLLNDVEDETYDNDVWTCFAVIDPMNYKVLLQLLTGPATKNKGSVEVLDMAVAASGDL